MDKLMRERFNSPAISELEQKTALVLVNSDDSIEAPEPLEPNMIQVGGLQIKDPKPLPEVS